MKLHMVDVVGQYQKIKSEVDAAVHAVLDSGNFILGKEVGEFECAVAGYLDVRFAVGCGSGTDALQIAMMALGIGTGDEVITTPFTFVATTETIALIGATPVYVDIDERTFNIDPAKIEKAITPRTKAIIPVHLYGQAASMDAIMDIARRRRLKVIEDVAQAFGASYQGKKLGTIGDVGTISYFPSKNLGAYGDAGMMVCNDEDLARRMKMITIHGSKVKYHHEILGVNSRLDTLQAAILKVKLKHLDAWNEARRSAARRYEKLLADVQVVLPYTHADNVHIFHQYTIRVARRDALSKFLGEKGIPHAIYYPIPLHKQAAYADGRAWNLPVTERICSEVLSLPMHTELTEEQQIFITETIRKFYHG